MLSPVNKKRLKLLSAINNSLYLHIYKYDYGSIDRDVSKEVAVYLYRLYYDTGGGVTAIERSGYLLFLPKIKQLLLIISESAPFIPNISKLSESIGITRNALLTYLSVLAESKLTYNLLKSAFGISRLQKPDKIYLENTNLMYVLSPSEANIGNIRETFFANQLKKSHQVTMSEASDFLVDGIYTFEIGGKRKGYSQIEGIPNGFIVADDIEIGFGNKIPLWMMGFLY